MSSVSSKDIQKARRMAKRTRSSIACASCKTAKSKCSDYRPCKHCFHLGTACKEVRATIGKKFLQSGKVREELSLRQTQFVPYLQGQCLQKEFTSAKNATQRTSNDNDLRFSESRADETKTEQRHGCRSFASEVLTSFPCPPFPVDFTGNHFIPTSPCFNPPSVLFPPGRSSAIAASHMQPFPAVSSLPPAVAVLLLPPAARWLTPALAPAPALTPSEALCVLLSLARRGTY